MTQIVLTVLGEDRPGLVADLADLIETHQGNWLTSELARLGGSFAGIVLVDLPEKQVDSLKKSAKAHPHLDIKVKRAATEGEEFGDQQHLHLIGQDRPGIVKQITSVLAAHGVWIDDFSTDAVQTPQAGGILFEANARVRVPGKVSQYELRTSLEELAGELMVDIDWV